MSLSVLSGFWESDKLPPYSLSVRPDLDSTDNTNKSTSLLFLIRVYRFLLYSEWQMNGPDDTMRAAAEKTYYFPRVYPYHFYIKNSLRLFSDFACR